MRDPADFSTLISQVTAAEIEELIATKIIGEGMIPKVEASLRAASGGVTAHIINGREQHSILLELFTDSGTGTMIEGIT